MPDCETLRYSFKLREKKIDPHQECTVGTTVYNYAYDKVHSYAYGGKHFHNGFQYNYQARVLKNQMNMNNPTGSTGSKLEGVVEFCKKFVEKDFAIVKIGFASNVYTRSKFEVKTTFVERLSTFGKTH